MSTTTTTRRVLVTSLLAWAVKCSALVPGPARSHRGAAALRSVEARQSRASVTGPATVGGTRPAALVYPSLYDQSAHEKKWPLVMMLHGYGSDASYHDRLLGISARTSTHGFIALLPIGTLNEEGKRFWNGLKCCDFNHTGVDDIAYLTGIIKEAMARANVDPKRVYMVGHSNGGAMTQILGCGHAELFAGIVSVAPGEIPNNCRPSHPISVLEVCQSEDTIVKLNLCHKVLDVWSATAGCATKPTFTAVGDYDCDHSKAVGDNQGFNEWHDGNCKTPGNETTVTAWEDCGPQEANAKASVQFWWMQGARHTPSLAPHWAEDMLTWLLSQQYIKT